MEFLKRVRPLLFSMMAVLSCFLPSSKAARHPIKATQCVRQSKASLQPCQAGHRLVRGVRAGWRAAAPTAAPLWARAPIQPTSESGLLKTHYSSESSAQLIFHNLLPQMVPLLRGLRDYFYENWLTPEYNHTYRIIFRYNWVQRDFSGKWDTCKKCKHYIEYICSVVSQLCRKNHPPSTYVFS